MVNRQTEMTSKVIFELRNREEEDTSCVLQFI
jgi:hypothetical protein